MSGPTADPRRPEKLAKLAWGVVAYNLAVMAWGAFVRASGSGAGCGRHWPLCNGEIIPRSHRIETLIEMAHRVSSGVALVMVVLLLIATRRARPAGHPARRAAGYAMLFMMGEALLGAGLVLFELVAHDASLKRALSMALHLGNTFLLLAALVLTALALTPGSVDADADADAKSEASVAAGERRGLLKGTLGVALASILVVGASGSLAALGDTLFPAHSLREGIAQDFSPVAHLFVKLRLLHPFLAMGSGLLVVTAATAARTLRPTPTVRRASRVVTVLFSLQLGAGLLNVWLLAPVWMQLLHLMLADCTWIALVVLAAQSLGARVGEAARSTERQASSAIGTAAR